MKEQLRAFVAVVAILSSSSGSPLWASVIPANPTNYLTLLNGLQPGDTLLLEPGTYKQTVGISTKAPCWNWIVRNCTIAEAGTGMYFGNSDGTDPFIAGLIENNYIFNTIGYNMQVKHQAPRPTTPGIPTGKNVTIIRDNVFSKEANGASGGSARPNLLVGHWPLSGPGTNDSYVITGNFFYQNPTEEPLFQGEGNLALHNNNFVNHDGDAIWIQPHNDVPRNVIVFYNTRVSRFVLPCWSVGGPSHRNVGIFERAGIRLRL